ncbi:FAD:protein FMN transferase, partial [Micromonospora echinofusca]
VGDPVDGLAGGGLATARVYVPGRSGVLDPRTGLPPSAPWRSVTVAAVDTVHAAALAVGALVHGAEGPHWLAGGPARWWRLGDGS